MRLFLIPISTRRTLLYCKKVNGAATAELSYLDRATNKAAATWAQWEQAEKGWKKLLTTYGHRVLQRIPYEEWGLKSVPPLSAKREAKELQDHTAVELLYPGNVILPSKVLENLRILATERQDLHRRKMWWSLGAAPFTAPVALLPVIPNIPFFYLAYRGWSHWRALSGSKHLEFLLDKHLVNPISLPALEHLYTKRQGLLSKAPQSEATTLEEKAGANSQLKDDPPAEELLLHVSDGKALGEILQAPELHAEVERAITQVKHLLDQGKTPK